MDCHPKFTGFSGWFEIQTNPLPDLPRAQILMARQRDDPLPHDVVGGGLVGVKVRHHLPQPLVEGDDVLWAA